MLLSVISLIRNTTDEQWDYKRLQALEADELYVKAVIKVNNAVAKDL